MTSDPDDLLRAVRETQQREHCCKTWDSCWKLSHNYPGDVSSPTDGLECRGPCQHLPSPGPGILVLPGKPGRGSCGGSPGAGGPAHRAGLHRWGTEPAGQHGLRFQQCHSQGGRLRQKGTLIPLQLASCHQICYLATHKMHRKGPPGHVLWKPDLAVLGCKSCLWEGAQQAAGRPSFCCLCTL